MTDILRNEHTRRIACIHSRYHSEGEEGEEDAEVSATCTDNTAAIDVREWTAISTTPPQGHFCNSLFKEKFLHVQHNQNTLVLYSTISGSTVLT